MILMNVDLPFAPFPFRIKKHCSSVDPVKVYPIALCMKAASSEFLQQISSKNFKNVGHLAVGSKATLEFKLIFLFAMGSRRSPVRRSTQVSLAANIICS